MLTSTAGRRSRLSGRGTRRGVADPAVHGGVQQAQLGLGARHIGAEACAEVEICVRVLRSWELGWMSIGTSHRGVSTDAKVGGLGSVRGAGSRAVGVTTDGRRGGREIRSVTRSLVQSLTLG